jgi:hypothetical protein
MKKTDKKRRGERRKLRWNRKMKRRERRLEKIRRTRRRTPLGGENWEERNEAEERGSGREEEINTRNTIIDLSHSHTVLLRTSSLHKRLAYSW